VQLKSNHELLQEFVDAFNRLDVDALVAGLDPDIELHEWPEGVGSRSYRGPDGVREALGVWFEAWEWMQVEITDVQEAEDRSLVTLHQRARGRASEVEVEIDSYNVYRFADGRVTSIELFTDRAAAADAFDKPKERTRQQR
jgi:ketosteroid isomerase-like protein